MGEVEGAGDWDRCGRASGALSRRQRRVCHNHFPPSRGWGTKIAKIPIIHPCVPVARGVLSTRDATGAVNEDAKHLPQKLPAYPQYTSSFLRVYRVIFLEDSSRIRLAGASHLRLPAPAAP